MSYIFIIIIIIICIFSPMPTVPVAKKSAYRQPEPS